MIKKLSLASLLCFVIYFILQIVAFFPKLYLWAVAPSYVEYLTVGVKFPLSVQLSFVGQALCILPFGAVCFFGCFKKNITRINSYMIMTLAPVLYFIKTVLSNFIFIQTINSDSVSNMRRDVARAYECVFMATERVSCLGKVSLILICCAGALSITKYERQERNEMTLLKKISLASLLCFVICFILQIVMSFSSKFGAVDTENVSISMIKFYAGLYLIWQVFYILPFGA
nr:hypothetical protein [Oscillospiraceae bacterium]